MFELPKYVTYMLDRLHDNGYVAYIVGGAVRDILLGNRPSDFDIATSCTPSKISELFEKTIETGIKHGTVTVIVENNSVEITTFRKDTEYTDHRKPDSVTFISNIDEDLKRRDFTINAMAYSFENGLIDNFDGQEDIKNKIIKSVGDPNKRFNEDALRILRAFRFAAKLRFKLEQKTLCSALENARLLKEISRERIYSELAKILVSPAPETIEPLINCGAFDFLGINSAENLKIICKLPDRLNIRFFAFCQITKTDALSVCGLLKTEKELFKYCQTLYKLFDTNFSADRIGIKKSLNISNFNTLKDFYLLREVFENCSYNKEMKTLDEILEKNEPFLISHLNISGDDMLRLGVSPTNIGKILNHLLENVINDPTKNKKSVLINIATDYLKTQCTI